MTEHRYAEMHAHSNFSFLDGASHPEALVKRAAELGYEALAVTDHDGFYGLVRFWQAARQAGLPAVYGWELSLCPPGYVPDGEEGPDSPFDIAGLQDARRWETGKQGRKRVGRSYRTWSGAGFEPEHLVVLASSPERDTPGLPTWSPERSCGAPRAVLYTGGRTWPMRPAEEAWWR